MVRVFCFLLVAGLLTCCSEKTPPHLFMRLDSVQTNIGFVNRLEERKNKMSVLDYLYYYNGAGVGAGDIDNDGLVDLFFVSNHGANKLYLNKGNLRFEDITATAGVAGFSAWKTGVTLADVNGDGWLDIYVCALNNAKQLEGANELYINNKDNTFAERAADYGLDFSGMATQAGFFDYDHDGDLDLYLLTHGMPNARSYDRVMASALTDDSADDHIFRNDDGVFKDVSVAVGIDSVDGHGLGLTIADVNHDGWEDVYVANDFYEGDKLYINRRDGTFSNEAATRFDYFSRYAHGCDIADLDNDGWEEVMTADIGPEDEAVEKQTQLDDAWETFVYKKNYGFPLQFVRNTLQRNNGTRFSEIGAFAGIAATDWTWSILAADLNNDGRKDIFTSNGTPRRLMDIDLLNYAHKDSLRYAIDLSEVHIHRAIDMMPDGKMHNHAFENRGAFRFEDKSRAWGFDEAGYANGAVYADLDNDGDLDVITNNLNQPAGVYENRTRQASGRRYLGVTLKGSAKNTQGIGARVSIKTKQGWQFQHAMPTRGYLSSANVPLFFGLDSVGVVDTVMVSWPDNRHQVLTDVRVDQILTLRQEEAQPVLKGGQTDLSASTPWFVEVTNKDAFVHHENEYYEFYREALIPALVSREGPALAVADVNGDGLEDYFVGGAKRQVSQLYIQQSDGTFQPKPIKAFEQDAIFEDVDAAFADVDGDKDLDLYIVSGGNEFYGEMPQQFDRLYRNDGHGNFEKDVAALPSLAQNKSCVRMADVDGDGDIDCFVGGRVVPFHYGATPASFLLINDGRGRFAKAPETNTAAVKSLGMVTEAQWSDLDKDGDPDLIAVGDWMAVTILLNDKGVLKLVDNIVDPASATTTIHGFWDGLEMADFDGDGDIDFMVGNMGRNNVLMKSDGTGSLRLYTGDFDNNGKSEGVLARQRDDDKYYPVVSREELFKQMPDLFSKAFPNPKALAGLDMEALAGKLGISWGTYCEIDQFASCYFENTGAMHFKIRPLPGEVQWTKMYALRKADVNGDGFVDVIASGNTTGISPYQGALLAGQGTCLLGDGKGNFSIAPPRESGLLINGEVRNIQPVSMMGKKAFLFGVNNDKVRLWQMQK